MEISWDLGLPIFTGFPRVTTNYLTVGKTISYNRGDTTDIGTVYGTLLMNRHKVVTQSNRRMARKVETQSQSTDTVQPPDGSKNCDTVKPPELARDVVTQTNRRMARKVVTQSNRRMTRFAKL